MGTARAASECTSLEDLAELRWLTWPFADLHRSALSAATHRQTPPGPMMSGT
jgi:hypothetical protein